MGGGIYITDGAPTFDKMLIQGNISYWGAGIYSENAEPIILNSQIRNNEAYIEGGGLYQLGGVGQIEWTSFEQNLGYDFGAGIVAHEATINLNQTTFEGNISGTGSVIACHGGAVAFVNSILWDNIGDQFYSSETSDLTLCVNLRGPSLRYFRILGRTFYFMLFQIATTFFVFRARGSP